MRDRAANRRPLQGAGSGPAADLRGDADETLPHVVTRLLRNCPLDHPHDILTPLPNRPAFERVDRHVAVPHDRTPQPGGPDHAVAAGVVRKPQDRYFKP